MATTLPPSSENSEASTAEGSDLARALKQVLDGPNADIRDKVRGWLSDPDNAPRPDLPMEEHRAQVLAWTKELASEGDTSIGFPTLPQVRRLRRPNLPVALP